MSNSEMQNAINRARVMAMVNAACMNVPLSGTVLRKVLRPETKKVLRNVIGQ